MDDEEEGQDMTDQATRLHELLLGSEDIGGFLKELVATAAESLTGPAGEVWCAILLVRPKRPATVATSDPRAQALDEVQYDVGEGPCLTAAREGRLVYLTDTLEETRWPAYRQAAADVGVRSALGVPLELGGKALAALDVYSDRPHAFEEGVMEAVQRYAVASSTAMRLAVRLARHQEVEADLRAVLTSRTSIDLAAGILMGRHHCTQQAAVEMLRNASNARNVKLRDLAAELVRSVGNGEAATHFDD